MRLEIYGKTNHDYCMVNTAIFHLKDGGTITIDRDTTEYVTQPIAGGEYNLSMLWRGCYLWAINGRSFIKTENDRGIYQFDSEELTKLLEGATLELELEDDADEDYIISHLCWNIFDIDDKNHEMNGTGYDPKNPEYIDIEEVFGRPYGS